jgi:hypothetical protein
MADNIEGRPDTPLRLMAEHLSLAADAVSVAPVVADAPADPARIAVGNVAGEPRQTGHTADEDDIDEVQGEAEALDAEVAQALGTLDLAELASLSDVALPQIDPEDMPLVVGGGAAGIVAIALIASGGGGGGGGGDGDGDGDEVPVPPLLNVFDLLADNPGAGPFTINGTPGETDLAQFEFQTVMDQARSEGDGQVFNINGFDAAEGDRIQFVQTDGGTLDKAEFVDLVDPVANGFADTTTFNFLNAAGGLSAQLVVEGTFNPPADAADPFFNLIEVV